MDTTKRPADELLEVLRVLLLVQGAVLVATTIEAMIWSLAFPGAAVTSVLLSGAAALSVLLARTRLRPGRSRSRRVLYIVEVITLVSFAIDLALGVIVTGAVPPLVAILTRFVLPLSVIALLRRSSRPDAAPAAISPMEAMS